MKTKPLLKKVKASTQRKVKTVAIKTAGVPNKLGLAMPTGFFPALVIDNLDPQNLGRIKVRIPLPGRKPYEAWARIATLMAGKNKGTWFICDIFID